MSDKIITLATLKDATAQQVFDQVVDHLRKQGERAYNDDPQVQACQYRVVKEDGTVLKCAAGCLIGDDEYVPEMDNNESGTSWGVLIAFGHALSQHEKLISDLQVVHDAYDLCVWERGFKAVSTVHDLFYTPPA